MFFEETIKSYGNKRLDIYIDMDGVIADYEVGLACNYDIKRPLFSTIKKLEEISKLDNIKLYILSVTRLNIGIDEKNEWLDKYVPFIPKERRILLSREKNNFLLAKKLKSEYIKNLNRDDRIIIIIDDDPVVLKELRNNNKDVVLYKDTVFVD